MKSAKEQEIDELVRQHAVVTIGNTSARIVRWTPGIGGELHLDMLTVDAFKLVFEGRKVTIQSEDGDETKVALSKYLLKRLARYDGLAYAPGEGSVVGNHMNLWRGFSVEPVEGDWSLMDAHIYEVIANGDKDVAKYIMRWLAWLMQNPGRRAEVALVLRGGKGAGKGVLGNTIMRIFGLHAAHISNRKHLVSGFNRPLMHCSFLFADEAYWPGDQSAEGELKRLITEPTLFIEPKGVDAFPVKNCLHVMIAGNDDWIVPASADERRFAVVSVSGERVRDAAYFKHLHTELNNGGVGAMLHDLLHAKLGSWHPRDDIPQTFALMDQKEQTVRGIDALIAALIEQGRMPYPGASPNICVTEGEESGMGLWAYAKRTIPSLRHVSIRIMSKALQKDWGCTKGKSTQRVMVFPPLPELAQRFAAKYGHAGTPANEDWA